MRPSRTQPHLPAPKPSANRRALAPLSPFLVALTLLGPTHILSAAPAPNPNPADTTATNPAPMLESAGRARHNAEDLLAQSRQQHLHERQALAAELQQLYDQLATAENQERSARQRLASLENRADQARTASADPRARNVLDQLASTLTAPIDPAQPVDQIQRALTAALDDRFKRLDQSLQIHVKPEPVIGRNGAHHQLPVLRLGSFAAYACGRTPETCGLLQPVPNRPPVITGPELAAPLVALLHAAVDGPFRALPIDVSTSLAQQPPQPPRTLPSWLAAGGPFVYPILLVALAGLLLTLERLLYLLSTRSPPDLVGRVSESLARGARTEADQAARAAGGPTRRLLLAGIQAHGQPPNQRESAMESALLAEAPRIERSLALIGALASVAPLLGLLGTVSGMVTTFNTIAAVGTGNPRLLSGGISEALITTQLGLMIGIPLLLVHAWLSRWAERREATLESDAIQVFAVPPPGEQPPC